MPSHWTVAWSSKKVHTKCWRLCLMPGHPLSCYKYSEVSNFKLTQGPHQALLGAKSKQASWIKIRVTNRSIVVNGIVISDLYAWPYREECWGISDENERALKITFVTSLTQQFPGHVGICQGVLICSWCLSEAILWERPRGLILGPEFGPEMLGPKLFSHTGHGPVFLWNGSGYFLSPFICTESSSST